MAESSAALKAHDYTVADTDGESLGTLRVKPSHLWWRSTGASKWRRIEFGKLIELVERDGEDVDTKPNQSSNGHPSSPAASSHL